MHVDNKPHSHLHSCGNKTRQRRPDAHFSAVAVTHGWGLQMGYICDVVQIGLTQMICLSVSRASCACAATLLVLGVCQTPPPGFVKSEVHQAFSAWTEGSQRQGVSRGAS